MLLRRRADGLWNFKELGPDCGNYEYVDSEGEVTPGSQVRADAEIGSSFIQSPLSAALGSQNHDVSSAFDTS